jgi:hypothetical protein
MYADGLGNVMVHAWCDNGFSGGYYGGLESETLRILLLRLCLPSMKKRE